MIELTSTLLRSLVTPVSEGVVVSRSDGSGAVSGVEELFEDYLGIKVPKRLIKWFKSPVRSESFVNLFEDGGSTCGFEFNRVKKGFCFWIQKPSKAKRYLSGIYSDVDSAFNDLSFLCNHLCDKSLDLSEVAIKLARVLDQYREG